MKITVENLGVIKQGSVEISAQGERMTILAGANNSGKSYMSYLVYGFYKMRMIEAKNNKISHIYENLTKDMIFTEKNMKKYITEKGISLNMFDFFKENEDKYQKIFSESLDKNSFNIFSDKKLRYKSKMSEIFQNFRPIKKIEREIGSYFFQREENGFLTLESEKHRSDSNQLLIQFMRHRLALYKRRECIFFPAERSSINLFAKEIFREKSQERDELARKIQLGEDLEKVLDEYKSNGSFIPRYPLPVSDYIYYVNDLAYAVEQPETNFADLADDLEVVMQGKVKLSAFGDVQFTPKGKRKRLPLHLSSSLVKSLSGLVIYFRHLAKEGDVVMIDEPELNLHPENQVRLARVLAKIANRGFNLIFSTHSDYILKELSNLTIMSNDFEGKKDLIQEYNYDEQSFLTKDKIKVYAFQNQTIEEVEITEEGFDLDKIDEVISDLSQRSNNIRFSFLESEAVYE